MAKKKTKPVLKPRVYDGIEYTCSQDIIEAYGRKWFNKWSEAYGIGNSGIIVPPFDPSHGRPEPVYGIYWHDFLRFQNAIDKNSTTYFD